MMIAAINSWWPHSQPVPHHCSAILWHSARWLSLPLSPVLISNVSTVFRLPAPLSPVHLTLSEWPNLPYTENNFTCIHIHPLLLPHSHRSRTGRGKSSSVDATVASPNSREPRELGWPFRDDLRWGKGDRYLQPHVKQSLDARGKCINLDKAASFDKG